MSATLNDIKGWLRAGVSQNDTHVIVVHDTYDHENYPVYVSEHEDVFEKASKYLGHNMQTIDEVYDLSMDIDAQLTEARAWHPDVRKVQ